jgi:hypothetical protein
MVVSLQQFHKHRTGGECKTWESHSSDYKDFCLLDHKSCSMVNKYQCLWDTSSSIFRVDVVASKIAASDCCCTVLISPNRAFPLPFSPLLSHHNNHHHHLYFPFIHFQVSSLNNSATFSS